jgi:hypothetical protein
MDDRREGPRRTCRLRASVMLPGHAPLPALTVDISRDGAALLLDCPLPSGTTCEVSFGVFAKGGVQQVNVGAQALISVFVRDAVRVSFSFSKVGIDAQRILTEFISNGTAR